MKDLILDQIKNLSREMREVAELRSEQQDIDADTFRITGARLETLYDLVDSFFNETTETVLCAARWKFLFNPNVSFQVRGPEVLIFQNLIREDKVVGTRLLSRGINFSEAVDAAMLVVR